MRLIQITHLKNWADSVAAESRFPRMLKELVGAVIRPESLLHLHMPSDDASRTHGFDGEVICREGNRFVPEGISVWEISTEKKIKDKANRDFRARSDGEDPYIKGAKWDRKKLTYVCATARPWRQKEKEQWIAERKAEDIWNDVAVIDGEVVQNWLELATAVSLSFLRELGIGPEEGLQSLDEAWEEWCNLSNPPITENLVLAGREHQAKEIIDLLAPPPSTFIVRTDSPRTAWGFALAAIREAASDDDLQNFRARTVVADDETVARQLVDRNNLIIVLKGTKAQVSGSVGWRVCNLIVP
jgi:hypothetical protein